VSAHGSEPVKGPGLSKQNWTPGVAQRGGFAGVGSINAGEARVSCQIFPAGFAAFRGLSDAKDGIKHFQEKKFREKSCARTDIGDGLTGVSSIASLLKSSTPAG